jgi:hypothetical protein
VRGTGKTICSFFILLIAFSINTKADEQVKPGTALKPNALRPSYVLALKSKLELNEKQISKIINIASTTKTGTEGVLTEEQRLYMAQLAEKQAGQRNNMYTEAYTEREDLKQNDFIAEQEDENIENQDNHIFELEGLQGGGIKKGLD